ncbi:MAG: HAD superfamily hydrolase (TIGR01509 family) [Verrucomicrobiales bacterium]|jgi:HAD superfamily hydrolase (TIGR01509 family)
MHTFGVLFDWDGVVIDSREQHRKSWEVIAERRGLPLPEGHFEKGFGMRNEQIIPEILAWASEEDAIRELADAKESCYRELIRAEGIQPLEGLRPLLESLNAAGIPCVVGSSTPRANIVCAMEITGIAHYFLDVVAGDDVSRGKPDPEVFLLAAGKAQRAPENCVVIEDAHVGIEAGRAGGMKVVAVATTHPIEELHGADAKVENVAAVTLALLASLFST